MKSALRLTVLACAIGTGVIASIPAEAGCINQKIGEIYLPLKLKNAPSKAHVMASVMTTKGLLEARAAQEENGASEITIFLDGKQLKPVAPSELRNETISCSKRRTSSISERLLAAFSALRSSVVTEANAAHYTSSFHCSGSGTVAVMLVDSVDRSDGTTTYFFQFRQGGHVCGWAAYSA
jgi:hypothetical protein